MDLELKIHKFAVLGITEVNIGSEVTKKELNITGYDITPQNKGSRTCAIIRSDLPYLSK